MALVATPGAANADSYFTLEEADAYFSSRGVTTWTGTEEDREHAARRGTSYLENQYRTKWIGIRTYKDQALAWPRVQGFRGYAGGLIQPLLDIDGFEILYNVVPLQVKHAAMEAALLAVEGVTLEPTIERGGAVKRKMEKIGPIEEETEWQDGAPAMNRYVAIDGLLRGLVTGSPGSMVSQVQLVRG